MIGLVRLALFCLLLVLTFLVLSMVIAVVRPETGPAEKGVLAVMIVGLFWLAAVLRQTSARIEARIEARLGRS